jgi:uncharacterized protein (PEP-CTERM system associated)
MLAGRRCGFGQLCMSSTILTVLLAAQPVHAQSLPELGTPTDAGILSPASPPASPPPPARTQRRSGTPISQNQGPPGPEFQAGASINVSDSYVTNASGLPGANQADYLSSLGISSYLHEHSRRLSLDANYGGEADFYARGTLPTQINNNLQAVGNADVIPNYLSLSAKAFAQPVVLSSLGIVTADNRVVPNGFSNSYGYYVNPDLRFDLGDVATSETLPNFGQVFFTNPPGSLNVSPIPGVSGPEDTTSRSLTEKISSGTYFDRFNWNAVGSFSETDRSQSLLSEKAGIANLRYAIGYEFSLLATAGYDGITNSTPLDKNVSGPVALGGFGLTFGKEFSLQIEAGEKYNSPSYSGTLHWDLSPRALISATANDYVQTPEGQLLNNLTGLTALPDGSLGAADTVLGNGSPSSLSTYNIQSQGNTSLDQNISRYQTVNISFAEEFERNHASISLFGTRRTILSGVFIGPPKTDSWGTLAQFSRDLTPLLRATIIGTYSVDDELGSGARTYQIQSQLGYQLSRQTSIYVSLQYLDRSSSAALQALSPLTGSSSDVRATIGVSHAL